MGVIKDEKSTEVHECIQHAWKYYKNFYPPEPNNHDHIEYWERLIGVGDKVIAEHENQIFMRALVLAIVGELERNAKELKP